MEKALKFQTEKDVRLLVRHPDMTVRAGAAQRICHKIRQRPSLSDAEREFAYHILTHMCEDSAAMVRRALAVTLQNSPELPRDIARRLALDIENIAVPVLINSPVFTDDDLIEVLKSRAASKVMAVARRPMISDHIVRAIVSYGDSHAVAEVAANDSAEISEETAHRVIELYHDNDLIKESFITRRDLPPTIFEKLIALVSEEAAIHIQRHYDLPVDVVVSLAQRARERASLDFIDQSWSPRELGYLVDRLHREGRLTASMIIRAVCSGQMHFTEHALAQLAQISWSKANVMIHDAGPLGLKALCTRAGLEDTSFKVIRAACVIYRDLECTGLDYDRRYFQSLMLQRVLTLPFDMPDAEQTYFLEKLDSLI